MTFERHLLAAFQAVADHGTVGRAARALNGSQPTISRHIRSLEEQLGEPLFDRDSKGMHLTLAGAELLPRVRLLLYEMAAAQDMIDAHRGLRRGAIRIGGVAAIARSLFPDVLALINERAPDLRIELTVGSQDQVLVALADREVDIIFAEEPPADIEVVRLGTSGFKDRCVTFCAPSNPLVGKGTTPLVTDVLNARWAMPRSDATPRRQFEALVRSLGFEPPKSSLQTDSVETVVEVVARSNIIAWLPEPLLTHALARGEIMIVPVPALELHRSFSMYRRARGSIPASAQIFIDAVSAVQKRN